ncbi:MAG: aminotransferase class I/II-fold pyridoxal phosphate-dependent enzyme [Cyanobacteria bacterium SZAS LIN-3]|nr:aminotransferase class I/II-fold pyridoxal phosphate-dependent enzyme [Cyanobacteria bacterium SZAS LIN-3]
MVELKPMSVTASELPVSGIRRFFDVAAQMHDVISLGVGEPDFFTPWSIREAAIYSLERGQTTYTSNHGLLELRREIVKHIKKHYGVSYKADDEVLVTVGVSEGLDLAMRTLLDPGDEVLVPEPCYVSYKPCITLAGGRPIGVETTAAENFRITPAALEKHLTPRTKAILLGYPSNPTGATMPGPQMQEIVDFAVKHGLYLISDEIYDRLTYDGVHTCVSSLKGARERTILLNGFSKAYAMTGWRIGYVCAPREIVSIMTRIHSYTMLCAPTLGQKAALEALKTGEPEVVDMVAQYGQRRRLIVDGLNKIGLKCHMPEGAFYAFPSIASTGLTSEEFAEKLLYQERVAVVPGTAFGAGGQGHIRCSYATAIDKIEAALLRMKTFVESLAVKAS